VDSKAEYTALSSTRSQKLKQTKQCPFNSVQVKIREVSPEVDLLTYVLLWIVIYSGWLSVQQYVHSKELMQ